MQTVSRLWTKGTPIDSAHRPNAAHETIGCLRIVRRCERECTWVLCLHSGPATNRCLVRDRDPVCAPETAEISTLTSLRPWVWAKRWWNTNGTTMKRTALFSHSLLPLFVLKKKKKKSRRGTKKKEKILWCNGFLFCSRPNGNSEHLLFHHSSKEIIHTWALVCLLPALPSLPLC